MNLESGVLQVHVEDIIPNRFQPRLNFDEQGLKELSDSIKEHGIIQPLVLRKLGNKYEIIAGERRFKAAQLAGLTTVPAVISNIDDNKSAEVALVENVQRRDLTAIEEARSYKSLLDKGYLTQEQLAKRMGLSQPSIANKLRLLNLDEEVQQALLEEKISERHARTLLSLDKEAQKEWLHKIINERLTVRQLDLELKKLKEAEAQSANVNDNSEDDTIPLVDANFDIEKIKANAIDLKESRQINQEEKEEVEEQPLELNTENFEENFTKASNKVPQMNIATPDSASTLFNGEDLSNNKFFNFINELGSIEPPKEETTNTLEVIDEPTTTNQEQKEFIDFEESKPQEELKQEELKVEEPKPTFTPNYDSANKFFNFFEEPKQEETNQNDKIVNAMDSVNNLVEEPQTNNESLGLKDAINTIRNTIQDLGNKGFFINVEEIDFDNNYQITIKINKE